MFYKKNRFDYALEFKLGVTEKEVMDLNNNNNKNV